MSKIELPAVTGSNNTSRINDNFQKIEDALNQEVLYRKGYVGEPNEMETDLDMNSNRILNLPEAVSDSEPATLGQLKQVESGVDSLLRNELAAPTGVDLVGGASKASDLAAGLGSSLVGFQQAGTGSSLRTTQEKMREHITPQDKGAIGDAATTTYVFGTVQNRSDINDKTGIRDTVLGIDFIMGLRPVDGRWDMRDDYTEEYQVQTGVDDNAEPVFESRVRKLPKDGSKARRRFHHWFIAQEVKELCDRLGVDFGGYQDHSVNGGCDIKTLGYDEFIPPTVKAVQQCWLRLDELENRISVLEKQCQK